MNKKNYYGIEIKPNDEDNNIIYKFNGRNLKNITKWIFDRFPNYNKILNYYKNIDNIFQLKIKHNIDKNTKLTKLIHKLSDDDIKNIFSLKLCTDKKDMFSNEYSIINNLPRIYLLDLNINNNVKYILYHQKYDLTHDKVILYKNIPICNDGSLIYTYFDCEYFILIYDIKNIINVEEKNTHFKFDQLKLFDIIIFCMVN